MPNNDNKFKLNFKHIAVADLQDAAVAAVEMHQFYEDPQVEMVDYKGNPLLARLIGNPEAAQRQQLMWKPTDPLYQRTPLGETVVGLTQLYQQDDQLAAALNSLTQQLGRPPGHVLADLAPQLGDLRGRTLYCGRAQQLLETVVTPQHLLRVCWVCVAPVGSLFLHSKPEGVIMVAPTRNGGRWALGVCQREAIDTLGQCDLLPTVVTADSLVLIVGGKPEKLEADMRLWSRQALLLWLRLYRRTERENLTGVGGVLPAMRYSLTSTHEALLEAVAANAVGWRRGGKKLKKGQGAKQLKMKSAAFAPIPFNVVNNWGALQKPQ